MTDMQTTETSLEEVIEERQFAGILQTHGEVFFRTARTLLARDPEAWNKKHFFQLIHEADAFESFLDDYGARYNRTYSFFTELVASLRGFALAGYSLSHLRGRLDSYGLTRFVLLEDLRGVRESLAIARSFVQDSMRSMLRAVLAEVDTFGVETRTEVFPEDHFLPVMARQKLPRNVDQEELSDERQKIAEVATKYIQASEMLRDLEVRRIVDPSERRAFLARSCTEEQARVYEATVHNLQSSYDTYIKNTVFESQDQKLPVLRGHASLVLHLLEAVTYLTHFYERHENDIRSEEAKARIAKLVDRSSVQEVILNHLLLWADRFMQHGRFLAEELLPNYTNARELVVDLEDGLVLHARPAALIVGIVQHHGTPVELEVSNKRCNAASILELLIAVGSHPDQKRYVFRGDEKPLQDIGLLFQHALGERGIESLPAELSYLRSQ